MKKAGKLIGLVVFFLTMSGCSGVEPEKRIYPLILAADYNQDNYEIIYGMPNLSVSTGQNKSEDNGDERSNLILKGRTLEEIQKIYDSSQEKYLDMGHLQAVILGENLISEGKWISFLCSLRENPSVGEDIYLFRGKNPEDIMELNGKQGSSLGEFLIGIYENRPSGEKKKGCSLRMVYGSVMENGVLPDLPELVREEDRVRIIFPEENE